MGDIDHSPSTNVSSEATPSFLPLNNERYPSTPKILMSTNSVADGHYRIRKAGAKSDIAKSISNGKKCHYVQIGIDRHVFENLEDALEYVDGKGLVADSMSLDFGMKKPEPPKEEAVAEAAVAETDGAEAEATEE